MALSYDDSTINIVVDINIIIIIIIIIIRTYLLTYPSSRTWDGETPLQTPGPRRLRRLALVAYSDSYRQIFAASRTQLSPPICVTCLVVIFMFLRSWLHVK